MLTHLKAQKNFYIRRRNRKREIFIISLCFLGFHPTMTYYCAFSFTTMNGNKRFKTQNQHIEEWWFGIVQSAIKLRLVLDEVNGTNTTINCS